MTHHADNLLEFELHANAETLPKWPYAFVLRSTFTLEGETVHHTLTVENPVEDKLLLRHRLPSGFCAALR